MKQNCVKNCDSSIIQQLEFNHHTKLEHMADGSYLFSVPTTGSGPTIFHAFFILSLLFPITKIVRYSFRNSTYTQRTVHTFFFFLMKMAGAYTWVLVRMNELESNINVRGFCTNFHTNSRLVRQTLTSCFEVFNLL